MMTDQQRAELRALAEECAMSVDEMTDAQFRRVSTAAREAVPALLADLEEARQIIRQEQEVSIGADNLLKGRIYFLESELADTRKQNEELRTQIVELRDLFLRENVRANKECCNNIELRSSMQSAIEQAVAPYKRDAERYQWLRQFTVDTGLSRWMGKHQTLDEAIDAALSAKEKSNG